MRFKICLLLGGMLAGLPAAAEIIVDPTAPPVGFRPHAADMYPAPLMSKGGLQGIISSKGGAVAIINGQMIKTGEYYGDAKLIEAGGGRALLQSAAGRQTLYLRNKQQWIKRVVHRKGEGGQTGTVATASLKVRKGASLNAAMTGGVQRGDRLEILRRQGDWLHIRTGQLSGFVHRRYIIESTHAADSAASLSISETEKVTP